MLNNSRGNMMQTDVAVQSVDIRKSINDFAFKLHGELTSPGSTDNLVFSPFSLHTLASMLHAGSATITREELTDLLNFPETGPMGEGQISIHDDIAQNIGHMLEAAVESNNSIWPSNATPISESFTEFSGEEAPSFSHGDEFSH